MTREEFEALRARVKSSGKTLKAALKAAVSSLFDLQLLAKQVGDRETGTPDGADHHQGQWIRSSMHAKNWFIFHLLY